MNFLFSESLQILYAYIFSHFHLIILLNLIYDVIHHSVNLSFFAIVFQYRRQGLKSMAVLIKGALPLFLLFPIRNMASNTKLLWEGIFDDLYFYRFCHFYLIFYQSIDQYTLHSKRDVRGAPANGLSDHQCPNHHFTSYLLHGASFFLKD